MTAPRLAKGWAIYDIVKRLPEDSRKGFLVELKMMDPERYYDYLNYKRQRLEFESDIKEDD